MPDAWTGEIIRQMHINRITATQLAAEVGWHPKYLSAVLNGRRNPSGADRKLTDALERIICKI